MSAKSSKKKRIKVPRKFGPDGKPLPHKYEHKSRKSKHENFNFDSIGPNNAQSTCTETNNYTDTFSRSLQSKYAIRKKGRRKHRPFHIDPYSVLPNGQPLHIFECLEDLKRRRELNKPDKYTKLEYNFVPRIRTSFKYVRMHGQSSSESGSDIDSTDCSESSVDTVSQSEGFSRPIQSSSSKTRCSTHGTASTIAATSEKPSVCPVTYSKQKEAGEPSVKNISVIDRTLIYPKSIDIDYYGLVREGKAITSINDIILKDSDDEPEPNINPDVMTLPPTIPEPNIISEEEDVEEEEEEEDIGSASCENKIDNDSCIEAPSPDTVHNKDNTKECVEPQSEDFKVLGSERGYDAEYMPNNESNTHMESKELEDLVDDPHHEEEEEEEEEECYDDSPPIENTVLIDGHITVEGFAHATPGSAEFINANNDDPNAKELVEISIADSKNAQNIPFKTKSHCHTSVQTNTHVLDQSTQIGKGVTTFISDSEFNKDKSYLDGEKPNSTLHEIGSTNTVGPETVDNVKKDTKVYSASLDISAPIKTTIERFYDEVSCDIENPDISRSNVSNKLNKNADPAINNTSSDSSSKVITYPQENTHSNGPITTEKNHTISPINISRSSPKENYSQLFHQENELVSRITKKSSKNGFPSSGKPRKSRKYVSFSSSIALYDVNSSVELSNEKGSESFDVVEYEDDK